MAGGFVGPGIGAFVSGLGDLGAFLGFLVVVLAIAMFVEPDYHLGSGVAILAISLISIFAGGGFFLGLLLGVVGGILGIIFQPTEDLDFLETLTGSRARCPRCQAVLPGDGAKFCARCGAPVG